MANGHAPSRKFLSLFRAREDHIPIPISFSERWIDSMEDVVILKDPVGNRFPVRVCVRRGCAYLCFGIEQLREVYSLHSTFMVKFAMINCGLFRIRVFRRDANELRYPPLNRM
ncbi:DNA-binding barrel domain superfamily [Sesbania bispinosa]|nr:DNA-binding barrel domain superfamily [Sesbania bispinosa]